MNQPASHLERLALAMAIVALISTATAAETLRDVLRAQKAPSVDQSLPNLDKPITSYRVLNDGKEFLIAYYLDDGSGALKGPLIVSHFEKVARKWRTGEIPRAVLEIESCLGSAIGAQAVTDMIYLELHINPSASCTFALSSDMSVKKVLRGWFLAAYADGRVVYHENEIHFAPVHAAELSLFDPRTGQELKIYPRKPFQSIRAAHIEKLRAFYNHNEDWCNAHNNPCDPEWFDNDISGGVAVNDKTDSLAFIVRFDNTSFWSDAERANLEAFRETRNFLREHASAPSDALFLYFYADLGRIGTLKQKPAVLDIFPSGGELRDFLAAAFEAKESAPDKLEDFTAKFGPRWGGEGLRKQFLQAIQTPPEFTNVLYVFRNLAQSDSIEYRELYLDDWKSRSGNAPIIKALDADSLRQTFAH